jgi:hypothetical protein
MAPARLHPPVRTVTVLGDPDRLSKLTARSDATWLRVEVGEGESDNRKLRRVTICLRREHDDVEAVRRGDRGEIVGRVVVSIPENSGSGISIPVRVYSRPVLFTPSVVTMERNSARDFEIEARHPILGVDGNAAVDAVSIGEPSISAELRSDTKLGRYILTASSKANARPGNYVANIRLKPKNGGSVRGTLVVRVSGASPDKLGNSDAK